MIPTTEQHAIALRWLNGERPSASIIAKRHGIGTTKALEVERLIENAVWRIVRQSLWPVVRNDGGVEWR